jgi:Domain of unknown function (DUF5615)
VKKRVFLDECCSDSNLGSVFGPKAHVYTAKDLGVTSKKDPTVIDKAVKKKCLIVTVNRDFLDYYRNHQLRKGSRIRYFYGLIFLHDSRQLTRKRQLEIALKDILWHETREHDDLIQVRADGKTKHERLCHEDCRAESPEEEREWG